MDEISTSNGVRDSDEEPEIELSEFYRNHPCAQNKPYEWPVDVPSTSNSNGFHSDNEEYVTVDMQAYDPSIPFVPPSKRIDAPLASILNPHLDCVDPRRFFPDFEPDGTLRFSRLFASNIKASSRADIWWPSRTFHKKPLTEDEKREKANSTSDRKKLKLTIAPPPPVEEMQMDQDILLMRASNSKTEPGSRKELKTDDDYGEDLVPPWRNGPAKIWYDKMNVPSTVSHFDYGFKLKQEQSSDLKKEAPDLVIEDETFLPVNLIRWEDDVIYDGEDIRQQVLDELKSGKAPSCGWIPTQNTRTYESFVQHVKNRTFEQTFLRKVASNPLMALPDPELLTEPSATHSIFPLENHELANTRWEDDIIWDDQQMDKIPEPRVLTLDYYDDPLIFGMPDDRRADEMDSMPNKPFDRKEHQFTKKSKMILGQVQQRQKQEEEEQMETSMAQMTDKDPYNLSNDDYYHPKTVNKSGSAGNNMLIQHSIPSQNIHRTFFPTHLSVSKLRHWHRHPLYKRIYRVFGGNGRFVNVQTLTRYIRKMEEQREKMKQAEGGGDIFFMRDVVDLSGRDGELVLMEYSEEHPPLLNQPGMSTKIKNYYKRRAGKDVDPDFDFGDMAFSHNVPFLGQLQPGQAIQSIENNLYRAPIYRHSPERNDFLLIRHRAGWYIRKCPALFLVGQECPLYEVPSPNSKRATAFIRDFLLAFIYRLFWASDHQPRRLKMEDIKAAFPHYAESSVRKRLKMCSDFKRLGAGQDQNYWVLRPDFRLPSKEEVLAMVTPEMCCAQYSMQAAEQRLKDAGYGERYFFTPENEDDSDDGVTIEDEIKCAPWNTTRAFLSSMRGKCLLDQNGIADPSGCGQGFSYIRVSQKPQKQDDTPSLPKRLVTGTNADLRKLPLKEAKEICRGYGVKEDEINALSRWEIIDVIRTLSTQAAKAKADQNGGELGGMARFARGNIRFNFADMQEKYKKHCQHIFDLQNQTLANPETLSTDEGSSGEDSDNEEWSTRLESMLQASKGKKQISMSERARIEFENEEKERQDLKRMMVHGDSIKSGEKKEVSAEEKKNVSKIGEDISQSASKISGITANQKLKIYRTIKNSDGSISTRVEVVTRPQLIEAYTRIRTTKDETFIQVYAQMDEQFKEERRKEKRRLQDQLRRIKRNEMKVKTPSSGSKMVKKEVPIKPNLLKMRCSACQATGHMKTNKNCPLYGKEVPDMPLRDGMSDDEKQQSGSEVVAVEGTRLKINKKFLHGHGMEKKKGRPSTSATDRIRDDSMCSDGGDSTVASRIDDYDDLSDSEHNTNRGARLSAGGSQGMGKRRHSTMLSEEDYLQGPIKSVQRIRADPRVTMGSLMIDIVMEQKSVPGAEHLMHPVSAKKVRDYYEIIKEPMDLQKIKNKITGNKYELRKDFFMDFKKMVDNSRLYNGDAHIITMAAKQMFENVCKRVIEKETEFIRLEKAINPLLHDDDKIGFSFILTEIIQKCKNIPKSVAFHNPVDPKKIPHYSSRVSDPMDLGTMETKAKTFGYTTISQFKDDLEKIVSNCILFNGPGSSYTDKALEIESYAKKMLDDKSDQLVELERNINRGTGDSQSIDGDMADERDMADEGDIADTEDLNDDDDDEMETDGGILQDDLALSGNDMDDEDEEEWSDGMLQSDMHSTGQLNNDLALSDSDEETALEDIKKSTLDDNLLF